MQSDLCQQLFGVWFKFLFNAIPDCANESGVAVVYSPTSEWTLRLLPEAIATKKRSDLRGIQETPRLVFPFAVFPKTSDNG
jgi:hypothetical protein